MHMGNNVNRYIFLNYFSLLQAWRDNSVFSSEIYVMRQRSSDTENIVCFNRQSALNRRKAIPDQGWLTTFPKANSHTAPIYIYIYIKCLPWFYICQFPTLPQRLSLNVTSSRKLSRPASPFQIKLFLPPPNAWGRKYPFSPNNYPLFLLG